MAIFAASTKLASPFSDSGFWWRITLNIVLGLLVAFFLTWFMYVLIQSSDTGLDDAKRIHMLDFVRLKREESSDRIERKPERPEVEEAPPAPATPQMDNSASDLNALAVMALPAASDLNMDPNGFGIGAGEGEYLPIVKVAPIYPASASSRGIEGTCVVQYTVTTNGSTKDIKVVDAECPVTAFRRPSVAAAKKFKYKPRVINGDAVEVLGVRNKFIYVLDEENTSNGG